MDEGLNRIRHERSKKDFPSLKLEDDEFVEFAISRSRKYLMMMLGGLICGLAITLFVFLVVGIILMIKILSVSEEVKRVAIKSQDIADNANGVVTNVRGLTSVGGTVEMLVDKYVNPKIKETLKERKKDDGGRKEK